MPTRLPLQVLRRLDAGAFAHIDAGVAEDFRQRDRHRHERALPAALERRIGRKRQLGDVELLPVQHALEGLARAKNLDVEIDALGLHPAVDQRAGAVVVPAGERELEVRHRSSLPRVLADETGWSAAPATAATRRRSAGTQSAGRRRGPRRRRLSTEHQALDVGDGEHRGRDARHVGGLAQQHRQRQRERQHTAPRKPSKPANTTVQKLAVNAMPASSRSSEPPSRNGQARRSNLRAMASTMNEAGN